MHPTERELATLVHGSVSDRTRASLDAHVAACDACGRTLAALRRDDAEAAALLQRLDHAAPPIRADAVMRAARRARRWRSGRIAAAIALTTAALAGVSAALPHSPLHRALVRAISTVRGVRPDAPRPAPDVAPARASAGIALVPTDRLDVEFRQRPSAGQLRIRLVDGPRASLTPEGGEATFAVRRDRIIVDDVRGVTSFALTIPRALARVRVWIDTAVVFRIEAGDVVTGARAEGGGAYTLDLGARAAAPARAPPR